MRLVDLTTYLCQSNKARQIFENPNHAAEFQASISDALHRRDIGPDNVSVYVIGQYYSHLMNALYKTGISLQSGNIPFFIFQNFVSHTLPAHHTFMKYGFADNLDLIAPILDVVGKSNAILVQPDAPKSKQHCIAALSKGGLKHIDYNVVDFSTHDSSSIAALAISIESAPISLDEIIERSAAHFDHYCDILLMSPADPTPILQSLLEQLGTEVTSAESIRVCNSKSSPEQSIVSHIVARRPRNDN